MTRTCFATLITLCGLVSAAPAQVYTTYYAPSYSAYSHAPAYSSYGYSTGYGPLGLVDWNRRSWASPYRTSYYSSPYWSGYGAPAYTAAYAPAYSSTSFYAPTSYAAYSPSFAAYSPMLASADTCCMVPTCCPTSCCGTGLACASGNCPGGNCGMNYGPSDMSPTPDPASSGSSGSRRFESESDPGTTDPRDEEDGFRRSNPTDNYNGNPRGAEYGPRQPIEQRNNGSDLPKRPTDLPDADLPDDGFEPLPPDDLEKKLEAPEADPAADRSLLDLDSKLTRAPSLLRERHSMHARFGSPKLARAKVDPSQLPAAADLRIVQK